MEEGNQKSDGHERKKKEEDEGVAGNKGRTNERRKQKSRRRNGRSKKETREIKWKIMKDGWKKGSKTGWRIRRVKLESN